MEMGKPVGQVVAEADENDNVIGPERHGIGEGQEKWATKDGGNVSGGRQVEFTDRMADDRCSARHHDAFDGGVPQTQFALHGQEVLMGQFDLELANLAFDLL